MTTLALVDADVTTPATLSPAQVTSIRQARAQINIWTGAIRSGKTVASLLRWIMYVRSAPFGGRLVMIGRTKDTINRNLFSVLADRSIFGAISDEIHYVPGSNTATILGRVVDIIGANDALSETRLRGMTCVGAYVDEVTLVPLAFFTQLLGRMSVEGAQLFGTTNPDNPAHWLRKDFLLREWHPDLNLRHWHFTIDDNPALSAKKIAEYKAQFAGLFYKRFILGLWVAAEGAIYDMFDDEVHVVKRLPMIDRWLACGVDYGTTNPFHAVMVGVGIDKALYVTAEYRYDSRRRHRSMTDAQYSTALQQWLDNHPIPGGDLRDVDTGTRTVLRGVRPEYICVDPSAKSFVIQLQQDGQSPAKARNEVMDGIRNVASLLARRRLFVHKSCQALIDEFPGYSWDDKKALKGEDVPIKADDHGLDALRYAINTTESIWRPLGVLETT